VLTLYGACPEHGDERVARAGAAGDLVCVLSNDVRALLDLGDLREHHLLPADPTEVERFTLHGPGGDLDVKRKEAGWEAVAGGPVDDAAVEAWLAALRRVEGRYGPVQAYAAGAHTLSLTLASELRVAMAFSALPNGELGLVRDGEGLALTFAGDGPALVAAEAGRFTALTPFAAHKPSEVIAVSVRVGSTARKLALADGAFRAVGSAQPVADGIRVRELVRDLLKWQAAEYTGGAPRPEHGLQEPLAALAFGLAEGGTLALSVGARSGDTWAVSVVGRGVYRADGALLRGLYELAGAPIPSELAPTPPSADDDDEEPLLGHDHDEHAAHE
jgi:hypothetical protein